MRHSIASAGDGTMICTTSEGTNAMSEQNNPDDAQEHTPDDVVVPDPPEQTVANTEAVTAADATDRQSRVARLRAGVTKPRVLATAAGAAFLLVGGVAGYAIAGGDDGHDGHDGRWGHGDRAHHSGWQAEQSNGHGHGGGGR